MKKVLFVLLAFLLAGSGSLVFGQTYRGSRYNPYNPYNPPEQATPQERVPHESLYLSNPYGTLTYQTDSRYYLYERDYLTRPYITEYRKGYYQEDYFNNPYGSLQRRWYDTQLGTPGGGSGRGFEVPGMLTSPYEDTYLRQKQSGQMQGSFQERSSLDSDYTTIPYGADPRRWYDTPTTSPGTSPGTSPKSLEPSNTLSGPRSAKAVPSLSSEVLTSPFEKGFQPPTPGPVSGKVETTQELTPPALR